MIEQDEFDFDAAGAIKVTFGGRLLLDIREAAAVLCIGRSTLYELINAGDISVVHIGRSCRVPIDELVRYVERLRKGGAVVPAR